MAMLRAPTPGAAPSRWTRTRRPGEPAPARWASIAALTHSQHLDMLPPPPVAYSMPWDCTSEAHYTWAHELFEVPQTISSWISNH
jgi:hypothetical protein